MPRVSSDDDWPDDDASDDESWDDDDDSSETVPCPHCGAEMYEDSIRCPVCGEYVTHGASALSGRPMWYILLGIAGVIAAIAALLGLAFLF
jgi:hypothetical protein